MSNFFKGKRILITGGTGSWGQELTTQLIVLNPLEIIIYSRGEHKQVEMRRRFFENKNIKYVIGDIRDKERLKTISKGVDYIFHLAALKHVPICEENPNESVKTNIEGVQNIIDCAIENNVKKVIDVSTDKAVDPFNIYGTCKAVGEKLIIEANRQTNKTDFVCIRGGNVLGTNGSVVPLFIEQLKKTNKITITEPTMTRFIMRLKDAVGLLIKASIESKGGEIIVMNMPAITVDKIAKVMISKFGNKNSEQITIGIRPGEKLHELLISQYESQNAYILDKEYFVILPMINTGRDYNHYTKLQKVNFSYFGSNNANQLNDEEFVNLLHGDGWLNKEIQHDSLSELESLSKEEIIGYFRNLYYKS